MTRGSVIAVLPRSGLGNRLLVWARAEAFAQRHGLTCTPVGWGKRNIGPYLRRERTKRIYGSSFQTSTLSEWMARLKVASGTVCWEPDMDVEVEAGMTYGFRDNPHWADYFAGIRESRTHIVTRLHEVVREEVWETVGRTAVPVIGLHVRRGDFAPLSEGVDFATVGLTRTPLDYFIRVIATVRQVAGAALPVTLFSDGADEELAPLLALESIKRSPANSDVVDLLLLSRSNLIVASAGSTFSMWSGFLSNAPLLLHPEHIHAPVRPPDVNVLSYEGPAPLEVGEASLLLMRNIRTLNSAHSTAII